MIRKDSNDSNVSNVYNLDSNLMIYSVLRPRSKTKRRRTSIYTIDQFQAWIIEQFNEFERMNKKILMDIVVLAGLLVSNFIFEFGRDWIIGSDYNGIMSKLH